MAKSKRPAGRPSEFDPKILDTIWRLSANGGANVAQICIAVGIGSFSTFYRYREKYPEFREATDMCAMASCATLETALMSGAVGDKKIDSKAAMWMLYNKDNEQYKMSGIANTSDNSVNIKIGNINMASLNKLSSLELDRMLANTEQSIKAITAGQMPELENKPIDVTPEDDDE